VAPERHGRETFGYLVSAKGADVMPAWGIAPGIRLSGYPSAESATQFSVYRQFPNTARIEINTVPWDVTPMSEPMAVENDSRF